MTSIPMAGDCLDTNIVIALVKNESAATRRMRFSQDVCIPIAVLGELLYGIEISNDHRVNRSKLQQILTGLAIISPDATTAEFYAAIRAQLKRSGQPIPDNDIWIAATAMQHDLTLITRDSHFDAVEGLAKERWG